MLAFRRRGSIRHGAGAVRSSCGLEAEQVLLELLERPRPGGVDGQARERIVEQHRPVHVQVEVGVDQPLVDVDRQAAAVLVHAHR